MLTETVLRELYLVDLLPEVQIARRYGVSQVAIGQLRKKWGIPTLGQSGRIGARLPPLTGTLRDVLVGSLLGDGHLKAVSPNTAVFDERHSVKQEPYITWKARAFGPYFKSFYRWNKKSGDKTYTGCGFRSVTCARLKPFHDLFYPGGKRIFPANLPELITPLALAVWFMDDGSRGPRISFGLDDLSLHRAVESLQALGLTPRIYGTGSNKTLGFPGQSHVFHALVSPHVPDCMAYKLTPDTPRRRTHLVTTDMIRSLHDANVSVADIAVHLKIGQTTVRRRLGEQSR